MTKVLITGAAGFIGHHFVQHLLVNTDYELVLLDRLDHAGNLNRLVEIPNWHNNKHRCEFFYHDLKAEISSQLRHQIGRIDSIVHMAASTHVDRSIANPLEFVYSNVVGTANLLEYARQSDITRMVYFSTDEVFGPAPQATKYREWDRYNSGNPYSATKAGGEELCLAYHNTYGLPVFITHTMNCIGERQHPEKYVPMTIKKVRDGETVNVHAKHGVVGSRFYIHARNIADAVLFLLRKASPGEKYNIVGEMEIDNLTLAQRIADIQGKTLHHVFNDNIRPGHDLRYALDGSRMREMGWEPPVSFDKSLEKVVRWTLASPQWLIG